MHVPLLRLAFGTEEREALGRVLDSGMLVQGATVQRFEENLARVTGRREAVCVSSGTAALELALRALGVGPGDEVLCPNLTWPSPANAIALLGAIPVLVDVDPVEWNAGPEAFAAARTKRTRAAIAIDQFGFPARIAEIAEALPGIPLIEDAACAIGSTRHGKPCGSETVVACFSFHPRKVVTTGEGGCCVTNDPDIAAALRELRNHGQRAPGDFARSSGNHRLGELGAALGLHQLAHLDTFLVARREQAAQYREELPGLIWQGAAPGSIPNYQTVGALLPEGTKPERRDQFVFQLNQRGVGAGPLSFALHRLAPFEASRKAAKRDGRTFRVSKSIVQRGFSLPCFPGLTEVEMAHVIETVRRLLAHG
ncbi:MAG: DegT/DnrJ/EryC1/StrS family aminotransferase [Myxococcales bacterium]|nr:DegT/DnrJ/EryC1/StrS family aminotransferase [Myxococcales bacterium]